MLHHDRKTIKYRPSSSSFETSVMVHITRLTTYAFIATSGSLRSRHPERVWRAKRRQYVFTMNITFLTRKSALIYRQGLSQRVASLTLYCNGVFAIRAYSVAFNVIGKTHQCSQSHDSFLVVYRHRATTCSRTPTLPTCSTRTSSPASSPTWTESSRTTTTSCRRSLAGTCAVSTVHRATPCTG